MNREVLEVVILTISVLVGVLFMGGFLWLLSFSKKMERQYVKGSEGKTAQSGGVSLTKKVSDWYLTRGALPFWYVFVIDCLILVYCQMMASYLVLGGQALVPQFWQYLAVAVCSLPIYYIGMKLFRSYETIVRFSRMEDLARIVCALFVGTILVDVVKHFVPQEWLPVYPIWQEQLVMMVCAVVLMWGVRVLVKFLYEASDKDTSRMRIVVFGTTMASVDAGLMVRRDESRKGILTAFVRADEKEPHVTIEGADLLNPSDDLVLKMQEKNAQVLMVPHSAYPDFCNTYRELMEQLLTNGRQVLIV